MNINQKEVDMKKNKSNSKNPQGKSSNRAVGKRGYNSVARLSRVLLTEIKTVLAEGPESENLHAPGPGWKTWHKTKRRYQSAIDMNEEMKAWLKGGVIPLRVNQNRLAKKKSLAEKTIFTAMRLLVEVGVIRPLPDRGLYWAGRRDKSGETFIPIEIVLDELRDLRSVERADKETGTHTKRLLFQQLLRLKIGLNLWEKAERDHVLYGQKVKKRLRVLKDFPKQVPLGKTGVSKQCKTLFLEIFENKEFETIVCGHATPQYVFLTSYLKKNKILKTYILGSQKTANNGPKPRVPKESPRKFYAKLEKLAKRQQGPIDPSEKALKQFFLAERIVLNQGNDDLRNMYQLAGDEAFLPKLKRAVGYVKEISKSTEVKRLDLWKCVLARYRFLHSNKRWQMNWVGGHDFMSELVNVATVIQHLRDFKSQDNFRDLFTRWKSLCEKILGSHFLKGKHLEEFTEGLLFKAFESWVKIKSRVEHKYGYQFHIKDYIAAQSAYLRKYGKIESTGRVFLDRMAGEEAETRAREFFRKQHRSELSTLTRERKQELEEWWETVEAGKTPEEPNLEEKAAYIVVEEKTERRKAEETLKAEIVEMDAYMENRYRERRSRK